MKPRFAALCCYYGQWPGYFAVWLKSCSYLPDIDFILVSDIPTAGYDVPANVHMVPMSFAEVRSRVVHKFPEITVSLDRPYKLCDFKVAYGYVFDDLFCGYDYWGFYDIDTIWGDVFCGLKRQGGRAEAFGEGLVKIFPCGHLSFIRNKAPWNKIFELVNDVAGTPCRNNMQGRSVVTWQECFSSPDSHYYDEEGGLEPMLEWRRQQEPQQIEIYDKVDFDNILPAWRFDHFRSINFPEKSHCLVYSFASGHIYRHYLKGLSVQKEEVSYVHLSRRRLHVALPLQNMPDRFILYPNTIAAFCDWTLLRVLWLGRPRYLSNLLRRIMSRFL